MATSFPRHRVFVDRSIDPHAIAHQSCSRHSSIDRMSREFAFDVVSRVIANALYVVVGYAGARAGVITRDDARASLTFAVTWGMSARAFALTRDARSSALALALVSFAFAFAIVTSLVARMVFRDVNKRMRSSFALGLAGVDVASSAAFEFARSAFGVDGASVVATFDGAHGLASNATTRATALSRDAFVVVGDGLRQATHDDGGVYKGEWIDGKKHGVGAYVYPSGSSYEGEWKLNAKDGVGVYTYAKGGSYAGEFKRGAFHGIGVRALRTGVVKAGAWEENEFVEATTVRDCEGTVAAANAARMRARKAAEASEMTLKRLVMKVVTFPPVAAVIAASAANASGVAIPSALEAVLEALARATNPLMLVSIGALFTPVRDRMQIQAVTKFISVKYALGLLCGALATLTVPQSFATARGVIAALCVMPVPSIVMHYATENDSETALVSSIVIGSQVVSFACICGFAAVAPHIANMDRVLFSGALAASAGGVALIGALGVKALAPSRGKRRNQSASVVPTASARLSGVSGSRRARASSPQKRARLPATMFSTTTTFVASGERALSMRKTRAVGRPRARCVLVSVRSSLAIRVGYF